LDQKADILFDGCWRTGEGPEWKSGSLLKMVEFYLRLPEQDKKESLVFLKNTLQDMVSTLEDSKQL
jgi:hypothetical protein